MTPASPAITALPLTILATAPPVCDAEAEAALPDAVDDPVDDPAAVLEAAAEPDELAAAPESVDEAAAEVELAPPPETGLGVGLPAASAKLAQARRVRLWEWMTRLRLPKNELTPGSVER